MDNFGLLVYLDIVTCTCQANHPKILTTLNDNSLFVTLLDWCSLNAASDVHQNYWPKHSTSQYLRHSFLLHLCPRLLHKWGSQERIPREPTILILYSFAKPPLVPFIDPYWLMQIITKLQAWVEETAHGNLESYQQLTVTATAAHYWHRYHSTRILSVILSFKHAKRLCEENISLALNMEQIIIYGKRKWPLSSALFLEK